MPRPERPRRPSPTALFSPLLTRGEHTGLCLLLLHGLSPLALYDVARVVGWLPSPEEWESRAGNHGPWWGTGFDPPVTGGLLLSVCLLFLLLFGALIAPLFAPTGRRVRALLYGSALFLVQAALFLTQFVTLAWTVD